MQYLLTESHFVDIGKELAKIPMRAKINRKFLITGPARVGKSEFIQRTFDWLKETETDKIRLAGWKTGDLRLFKYEQQRLNANGNGAKTFDQFFNVPAEEAYGLITLDGEKSVAGFPY